jgi:ATP-dependent DNA helicase RecG
MLDTSIEYLKGVGPTKGDMLKKELGIFTYEQLLQHYPFRYIDRTKFHKIKNIRDDSEYVQIRGILRRLESHGEGRKRRIVGVFRDDTGVMELVWFKGLHWIQNMQVGIEYLLFGKPSVFNGKVNMVHPELEPISKANTEVSATLEAVYPTTEKLSAKRLKSKDIRKLIKSLLLKIHEKEYVIPENLPAYLIEKLRLPSRWNAIKGVHFPKTQTELTAARNRLKFEELFFLQLRMLQTKKLKQLSYPGHRFPAIGEFFNNFYQNNLKFELTGAQKRVIKEIRRDLGGGKQMNRLLQGDVGSGKTVVGFMCMLMAMDNAFQAAMMAPTEILAQQHFQSLQEMAEGLGIRVELLTGSVKTKQRRELLADLEAGEIHILVGTHALIEDPVVFHNLGLVIIDEQHRFGVVQRAKMWRKGKGAPPHILVMTATPIPRTLAMTVYGDLDVSVIDEMPPGRLPIQTFHKYESQRLWVFGRIKEEIKKGHQVYVVYPLIEESESETMADIKNLEEGYAVLSREFPMPEYQISIVHGKQKPEDKEFEMERFAKGETHIMIATTVIEVGVNVPNATVMIIENAERFGLAQLHQLRGRVGRGGGEAYCILMTGYKLSKEGKFRMQTMCATTDGFRIAEADLKLRGPGSLDGTQQSGIVNLKMADIVKDTEILKTARHLAQELIEKDPKLEQEEHLPLRKFLAATKNKQTFSRIS